jgi:hypothetical protein
MSFYVNFNLQLVSFGRDPLGVVRVAIWHVLQRLALSAVGALVPLAFLAVPAHCM